MNTDNLINKLTKLIYLDIDVVHAYEHTLQNMKRGESIFDDLKQFQTDHENHIALLNREIIKLGCTPAARVKGSSIYIVEGITSFSESGCTSHKLKAMKVNEILTNSNYKNLVTDKELPESILELLKMHYEDEKRHLKIINNAIRCRVWIK